VGFLRCKRPGSRAFQFLNTLDKRLNRCHERRNHGDRDRARRRLGLLDPPARRRDQPVDDLTPHVDALLARRDRLLRDRAASTFGEISIGRKFRSALTGATKPRTI